MNKKLILDVCCGGKSFWFNKKHPNVLYVDKRTVEKRIVGFGRNARDYECSPDKIEDFRRLSFEDCIFSMVVFDPPHFVNAGLTGYMGIKYGTLNKATWKVDLTSGFKECFRVLKPNGFLIFKWNEYHIPLRDILKLTPYKPLFGHRSGKNQLTHWVCFLKTEVGNET